MRSAAEREKAARKRRTNRGALPAHLPRIEIIVDIDEKDCPCCKGALHQIGEDVSERLDIVPAQFRVLVTRRPKCACRACEGARAIVASLIETCKLNSVDPQAYMADVIKKIVDGHLASKLDELMPWVYAKPVELKDVA